MDYDSTLARLKKSRFRNSFILTEKKQILNRTRKDQSPRKKILQKRIQKKSKNDGRQTPYKGHPVFIAQHATATCCRKCIKKWHKFPENRDLTDKEISELTNLITAWIIIQIEN
jgi:hypothetical protein